MTGDERNSQATPRVLPPGWPTLVPLLDAVLDAPDDERAARILELTAGDEPRRRALEALVAECAQTSPLLDGVAAERFPSLADDSPHALLPELIGGRYRKGREIGRGGMARVYLARDEKHGRDVAIKVIRPDISRTLGHDRFLREIEIAARLRHPNIVPLYDSGDAGGALFFVMPYEEGMSLRERLTKDGALPMPDALAVLRDIARALAYAHEHGVVHRDVKPDNVMLTGDAAVVTDFGIAKALGTALTDASLPAITHVGSAIGTPAYMSPEQAAGDPTTDHRADLYSFGCVAYELFTGHPPFHDCSIFEMIAGHMATVPDAVTAKRADVPPAVATLIAQCLEKRPADRPAGARELVAVLDGSAVVSTYPATTSEKATPRASRRLVAGALALVAVITGASGYFAMSARGGESAITVAVLPFGNSSGDSTLGFVTEGLADDVAGELTRVPGIQVKSRSGARAYSGQLAPDVTEAGAKLKADYIMTGVVRQDGGGWILSVDMARAADATSIWGESFQVSRDQQTAAARDIAAKLTATLRDMFPRAIGAARALAPSQRTSNSEAYRLYLRGRDKISRRTMSVKESADLFRAATVEDPQFALAHSGLSMALALTPFFHDVSAAEVDPEIQKAAHRALELDPSLAQPHIALAIAHRLRWQQDSANTEFHTAIRLDPRDVEARVQYARQLLTLGCQVQALRELQVARAEDPASALVLSWVSYAYLVNGQKDSAVIESNRALETDSSNLTTQTLGAIVRVAIGKPAEALRLSKSSAGVAARYIYFTAMAGDTVSARQQIRELETTRTKSVRTNSRLAYGYLGLGDTAKALDALERATDGKEIWSSLHGVGDPMFDGVRNSARFHALLQRVGLRVRRPGFSC